MTAVDWILAVSGVSVFGVITWWLDRRSARRNEAINKETHRLVSWPLEGRGIRRITINFGQLFGRRPEPPKITIREFFKKLFRR